MERARCILGAVLLVAGLASAAPEPASTLKPGQVEAVVALARLSGAVRYFDPADAAQLVDWDRFLAMASERMLQVSEPAQIGPELERLFLPWAVGVRVARSEGALPPLPAAIGVDRRVEWRHLGHGFGQRPNSPYISYRTQRDKAPALEPELEKAGTERPSAARFPLAAGWWASVPLQLDVSAAGVTAEQAEALQAMKERLPAATDAELDRARSVAAGIALWSFVRHFYPYWSEVKVDWDESLREWVRVQPGRQSRAQLADELRKLLANIDDGHGSIFDQRLKRVTRFLPLSVRLLGSEWIVNASATPDVRRGDVITTIDGRDAREVLGEKVALYSGSRHFKAWRAWQGFAAGEENQVVKLGIDRDGARSQVEVKRSAESLPVEPRPESLSQPREGIWYVDISRFDAKAFEAALPRMSSARAVVFDLRGYPKGNEVGRLASFWIKDAESTRWMATPFVAAPFTRATAFREYGWDVQPNPALREVRQFLLVDGRAISFSESLTGYFASQKQGTIVGEPTAGANGNTMFVQLPEGFGASITGMRVIRHDGTVMHGQGFAPDMRVVPTPEGMRAGRDEVLERALELAARPR